MTEQERLAAGLRYLEQQKKADPLESFRSLEGLKGAYERRVQPIINNAMQTFETGGAIGDLLRAYGSAAAPANAAVLEGMGMPYRGPITAPRQEGVSSGENFRAMGDPRQQAVGQMIGDPANLAQPVGARLANALKFAKPDAMKMVQELSQGARSQMVERQAGRTFAAPQDEALRLAQERAALPVERFGLGLPPNNTSEQRAAAMGGKDFVHFSRHGGDYATLDSGQYATAPFDAVGTHVGTPQAAMDRFRNTTATTDQIKGTTYPVTILGNKPLLNQNAMAWGEDDLNAFLRQQGGHNWSDIHGGKMTYQDMNADLRKKLFEKQGYTSIPYYNEVEGKGSISYIVPPENIRSRFAAYDPFRRNAAIAAAMGVAAPDLLAKEKKK